MPKNATLAQKIQWHADHARECGCRPIPRKIEIEMAKRKPKVVVGVLVRNKNKFLLARETLEGGKDWWIIPGGKVEFGEKIEEADVARERAKVVVFIPLPVDPGDEPIKEIIIIRKKLNREN